MTESMAAALGPKVRVNTIMPGRFLTDISAAWDPEVVKVHNATIALGRVAEPNEIVGAALYFASNASTFATGAILVSTATRLTRCGVRSRPAVPEPQRSNHRCVAGSLRDQS